MMKKLEVSRNIVLGVDLPPSSLPLPALKLSRSLFNKQSGRAAYKRGESRGAVCFCLPDRFDSSRDAAHNGRQPGAGGWMKTNYGGVKRQAQ